MILRIYQAPSTSHPGPLPDGVSVFVGTHRGRVLDLPLTFDRYGITWRVFRVQTPGPGDWTFRLTAAPASPITDH